MALPDVRIVFKYYIYLSKVNNLNCKTAHNIHLKISLHINEDTILFLGKL